MATNVDLTSEWPHILSEAIAFGVDPAFVAAIRMTENGGPGREFGVLGTPAPTYQDQLRVCCATVAHLMSVWSQKPMPSLMRGLGSRMVYHPNAVSNFASIWAPPKAPNDPNNLNANWLSNVNHWYVKFSTQLIAGQVPSIA